MLPGGTSVCPTTAQNATRRVWRAQLQDPCSSSDNYLPVDACRCNKLGCSVHSQLSHVSFGGYWPTRIRKSPQQLQFWRDTHLFICFQRINVEHKRCIGCLIIPRCHRDELTSVSIWNVGTDRCMWLLTFAMVSWNLKSGSRVSGSSEVNWASDNRLLAWATTEENGTLSHNTIAVYSLSLQGWHNLSFCLNAEFKPHLFSVIQSKL